MNKVTENATPELTEGNSAHLVLSMVRKMGWFKSKQCYLVFRDSEVLLIHLSKQNVKAAVEEYRAEQKAMGKGFFRMTMAMANFWKDYGNRYYSGSRDDLLALDSDNCALPYSSINRLIFKTARTSRIAREDEAFQQVSGMLIIKGEHGKMKFSHEYFDRNRKIKSILSEVLGKSLSYKAPLLQ